MDHFNDVMACRTRTMGVNAIREILKVVSRSGMVSLAGGIPAPESFPLDIFEDLCRQVLAEFGSQALQYGPSEGFGPLREALVAPLAQRGVAATADEVLIASGSQGVLDAVGMVVIDKGDRVAVEAPTYLGALQAFKPYQPQFVQIDTDDQGVLPESLETVLKSGSVKLVYLVPTFQNPTGRTLGLARRRAIAAIVEKYNVLLVEDDPYRDLRYRGEHLPPIKQFAPQHVVYVGTLSKIFAPGLRLGYCVAPLKVHKWLVTAKQGIDLHTSTFNQALAARYITGGHLKTHLPRIIALYRRRQEAMLAALDRFFPDGYRWTRPDGGMFIWAQGPSGVDMELLYHAAVKQNVAFVPGKFFYARPGDGLETLRLNFTMADPATLTRTIEKLSTVLAAAKPSNKAA